MAGAAAAQAVYGSMSMATALPSVSAGYSAATAAPAGTYTAAASAVTAPPASSMDFYSMMPYSSFTAGGYSSLECGYGYQKSSDGSCNPMSWVR